MVAADVGGAIKGEIRADFFWGFGDEAFHYAGRMKEKGKMYILNQNTKIDAVVFTYNNHFHSMSLLVHLYKI